MLIDEDERSSDIIQWLPNYAFVLKSNWHTRETQPIDPFVLEGLPLLSEHGAVDTLVL